MSTPTDDASTGPLAALFSAGAGPARSGERTPAAESAGKVKDPVCGMSVDPATAKHRAIHSDQDYFFCSAGCRAKFVADPSQYLVPSPPKPPEPPQGTIFTCPMHPEIRQQGPGSCPICGMALEPEQATAEAAPNEELRDMTRRFWIGLALALPVFGLEMAGHVLNLHDVLSARTST